MNTINAGGSSSETIQVKLGTVIARPVARQPCFSSALTVTSTPNVQNFSDKFLLAMARDREEMRHPIIPEDGWTYDW